MNIIKWAIHSPVFANLMMFFLLCSGFIALTKLKREATPVFSEDKVKISIAYPNAQPEEVEEGICIKIEQALEDVSEINTVESVALEGLAETICTLKSGSDIYQIMDKIKLQIDTITTFPKEALPPQVDKIEDRTLLLRIFLYGDIPPHSLQKLARNVRDELIDLPNVDYVHSRGINKELINVEVSEQALQKYSLSFAEVISAIQQNSLNHSSGKVKSNSGERNIYIKTRLYHAKDYEQIPVITQRDGSQIFLHQIATVIDDFEEPEYEYTFKQKYPAINFRINTPEHYDSLVMIKEVKQYILEKQKSLPNNVHIVIEGDYSDLIQGTIDVLFDNAIMGMLLVILTLSLFLNLRLAFWVAMGIPISFCGGFLILWFLGKSLNLISMFALVMVLGIVVDDAIVVGENVQTKSENQSSGLLAAEYGTMEMLGSVTTAVFTTIVIFVPLFFIPGTIGKWIQEIPLVVIAILLISLLESFFILPAHLSHAVSNKEPTTIRKKLNSFIESINNNLYKPVYNKALKYPVVVIALMLGVTIFAIGLVKGGRIDVTFFPKIDSENIYVDVSFSPGTSKEIIQNGIALLEKSAQKINEHFSENIVTNMYSGIHKNIGLVVLNLQKGEQRSYHSSKIVEAWRELTEEIPGGYFANFRGEKTTPGGEPVEIQLLSDNFPSLQKTAHQIKLELNKFKGVYSIRDDSPPGKFTVLPILKATGHLLGISQQDLALQLADGFAGGEIYKIQKDSQEAKVQIKYSKDSKNNSIDPNSITIKSSDGTYIPLSEVVTWKVYRGPEKIQRKNNQRSITIYANVAESITTPEKVLNILEQQTLKNIGKQSPDVTYKLGGQHKENKKSSENLLIGFQYAILIMFIIIALNFRSYLQPVILLIILPFSCTGAIFGHWIMGYPLSAMSLFGIVALCGVAVNDAIVFVEQINLSIHEGCTVKEALCEAGPKRFRAIVLTTVTTVCGLLPLLFEKSLKAYSIIPMAISMSFGLIFGTFITLFLVPILFQYLNKTRCIVSWLFSGKYPRPEEVEPSFHKHFAAQKKH